MTVADKHLDKAFEFCRQNPDMLAVHPSGLVLIALVNEETDEFLAIKARGDQNFLRMTEDEINDIIIETVNAMI